MTAMMMLGAVAAAPGASAAAGAAGGAAGFSLSRVGPKNGGGEPSIATGPQATLYVSYPSGSGPAFYRSVNGGRSWAAGAFADTQSGDTSVTTDQSGAVYEGNLNALTVGPDLLQADVYKSVDGGAQWVLGAGPVFKSNSSNNPLLTDRPWTAAWIPPGKTTDQAQVYLQYHDFGPSAEWVATSTDGGATFGTPVNVLTSPPANPAAVAASARAQAAAACNTIPGGVKVVASGPHAGRVYVTWLAADPASSVATGCNLTQLDTFHTVWVAWSDDGGTSWTDQQVFDGGIGHDASALFDNLALDSQGNPYVAFGDDLAHTPGATTGTWGMYVMAATAGPGVGAAPAWKGPFQASGPATKTTFFPAIAAGAAGKVDVAYLGTAAAEPTLPYGKPQPGGDQNATWYVYLAQSLNAGSAHPTWAVTRATPTPVHQGDVCTLGLFCVVGGNRDLLDFIGITAGTAGFAHIAYTSDITAAHAGIYAANQVSGPTVGPP